MSWKIKSVSQKDIERLQKLALRVVNAERQFSDALEAQRSRIGWSEACNQAGIDPESDLRDWYC